MEHVLIMGAGSGIGAAIARGIARPGLRMMLHTGSNRAGLETVARDCAAAGAVAGDEPDLCLGDLADPGALEAPAAWLAALPEQTLTGLVFAAGYARLGTVGDTPAAALEAALHAMPLAFHRLVALAAPRLTDGRGRVLCISAFGAHRARSHSFAATAPAKAALEAQVRVFAANLAPRGITVNALVPGFIEKEPGTPSSLTPAQWPKVTAGIPMGRIGRREEVATLGCLLLSAEASYVTGQAIHVDGGLML